MTLIDGQQLYSIEEVSQLLGMSMPSVRHYIYNRHWLEITQKIKNKLYFSQTAIDELQRHLSSPKSGVVVVTPSLIEDITAARKAKGLTRYQVWKATKIYVYHLERGRQKYISYDDLLKLSRCLGVNL